MRAGKAHGRERMKRERAVMEFARYLPAPAGVKEALKEEYGARIRSEGE